MQSRIPGFYKLSPEQRIEKIADEVDLTKEEKKQLHNGLSLQEADNMIENVVGYMPIPLGIAVNFKINGKDMFIPMATEEPSVVAAASNAARLTYDLGGFITSTTDSIMIGQIQLINVKQPYETMAKIYEKKSEIISLCNEQDETLVRLGGGAMDLEVRVFPEYHMVVIHLFVDTKDAMGANTVNTMVEAITPFIESIIEGNVGIRIISNLADQRIVRARGTFKNPFNEEDLDKFIHAALLANIDPYRAVTHNKGIMNGISAVALATGNDTRAIEAGAHAYAAKSGAYSSLTNWEINEEGHIVGTIELPLAVGIIGGATRTNKVATTTLKIMKVENARELAGAIAAVGLAQNFAALRALAAEGIQAGHMKLHVANLAAMAGADADQMHEVVTRAEKLEKISYDKIKHIVTSLNKE